MRLFLTTFLATVALSATASAQGFPPVIIPMVPIVPVITQNPHGMWILDTSLTARYNEGRLTQQHRTYIRRLAASCQAEIGVMRPRPLNDYWASEATEMCIQIDFRFAQQMRHLPQGIRLIRTDPTTVSPVTVTPPEIFYAPPCCVVQESPSTKRA